jgi:hypothetical protein
MAFSPSFQSSQQIGLPSTITLTDNSTGSDGAIASRVVFITDVANNYYTASGVFTTPTSTAWVLSNSSISINFLTQDMALQVLVQWLDGGGNVLYSSTNLFSFSMYGIMGSYSLTLDMVAQGNVTNDANYWNNRLKLRMNIDDANNAVTYGANQLVSQSNLNSETYLLANKNLFF